mmetsp:Transcript_6902/g.15054  ORF Transcript_6902/g.15054 Transcript_6902/m.15054 type:complete len:255 (+) Transcript_6902:465-1229(+)
MRVSFELVLERSGAATFRAFSLSRSRSLSAVRVLSLSLPGPSTKSIAFSRGGCPSAGLLASFLVEVLPRSRLLSRAASFEAFASVLSRLLLALPSLLSLASSKFAAAASSLLARFSGGAPSASPADLLLAGAALKAGTLEPPSASPLFSPEPVRSLRDSVVLEPPSAADDVASSLRGGFAVLDVLPDFLSVLEPSAFLLEAGSPLSTQWDSLLFILTTREPAMVFRSAMSLLETRPSTARSMPSACFSMIGQAV